MVRERIPSYIEVLVRNSSESLDAASVVYHDQNLKPDDLFSPLDVLLRLMDRAKSLLDEASFANDGAHSLSPNTFSLRSQVLFNNYGPSCSEVVPLLQVSFFAILLIFVSIFLRVQAINLEINSFFDSLEIISLALLPVFKGLLTILFQNFEILLFHVHIH